MAFKWNGNQKRRKKKKKIVAAVVLIAPIMLLESISIPNEAFTRSVGEEKKQKQNKSSLMNEGQVRQVQKTMRLQTLLCLCSRCTVQNCFGCGVARRHNAIIMFGNKVQPSQQLLLTSIEIQMLLNLLLKPPPTPPTPPGRIIFLYQHDSFLCC